MTASNNTRNSHASLIFFISVSLFLALAAGALILGPKYSPHIGVASAQILAKIDSAFKSALPTPWFRWFVLWSVAGAALSVIIGLLILPRSAEAPSSFERSTIATAELTRIVVIVLAVGVSFFDFITAPKDSLTASRRAETAKITEGGQPSKLDRDVAAAVKGEAPPHQTTPEQQIAVATSEAESPSVKIEGQTQPLSAKGDPAPQASAQSQPSRFDSQTTGSASQPHQTGGQASPGDGRGASASSQGATGAAGAQEQSVPNSTSDNTSLSDDLLPWERSPRESWLGASSNGRSDNQPGRTKSPYQGGYGSSGSQSGYNGGNQGGYGSTPPGGKGYGSQGGYASASPNPRDDRDQARQPAGPCDSVRGRFYNIKGRNNPDFEATIEIMARGRGLIRLMTRRGEVLLMDARVTSCNNNSITVLGSNGRTEAGVAYDGYREDVFVAQTSRQPREDWRR